MAPKTLRHGRPPLSRSDSKASISAKATRTIIRSHHTLQKRLQQAKASNDAEKARLLESELLSLGGLSTYQQASILGQSNDRGGDSSRVLVSWLSNELSTAKTDSKKLRVLEVGALSTTNALNGPATVVRRIDLHSQGEGIEEIDFMDLPLPSTPMSQWEGERANYDIISLSLVLNYVSTPNGRGEMLKRTSIFLRQPNETTNTDAEKLLPALFLVLPLPCINNSRYLDAERLAEIMNCLGYVRTRVKESKKLYYSLWKYGGVARYEQRVKVFRKEERRTGANRNNFAIVWEG